MSPYVQKISILWSKFAKENPALADAMLAQAFLLCEAMTSDTPDNQIYKMITCDAFKPLQASIIAHHVALGLSTYSDREIALWVRTICYCTTMRDVQSA